MHAAQPRRQPVLDYLPHDLEVSDSLGSDDTGVPSDLLGDPGLGVEIRRASKPRHSQVSASALQSSLKTAPADRGSIKTSTTSSSTSVPQASTLAGKASPEALVARLQSLKRIEDPDFTPRPIRLEVDPESDTGATESDYEHPSHLQYRESEDSRVAQIRLERKLRHGTPAQPGCHYPTRVGPSLSTVSSNSSGIMSGRSAWSTVSDDSRGPSSVEEALGEALLLLEASTQMQEERAARWARIEARASNILSDSGASRRRPIKLTTTHYTGRKSVVGDVSSSSNQHRAISALHFPELPSEDEPLEAIVVPMTGRERQRRIESMARVHAPRDRHAAPSNFSVGSAYVENDDTGNDQNGSGNQASFMQDKESWEQYWRNEIKSVTGAGRRSMQDPSADKGVSCRQSMPTVQPASSDIEDEDEPASHVPMVRVGRPPTMSASMLQGRRAEGPGLEHTAHVSQPSRLVSRQQPQPQLQQQHQQKLYEPAPTSATVVSSASEGQGPHKQPNRSDSRPSLSSAHTRKSVSISTDGMDRATPLPSTQPKARPSTSPEAGKPESRTESLGEHIQTTGINADVTNRASHEASVSASGSVSGSTIKVTWRKARGSVDSTQAPRYMSSGSTPTTSVRKTNPTQTQSRPTSHSSSTHHSHTQTPPTTPEQGAQRETSASASTNRPKSASRPSEPGASAGHGASHPQETAARSRSRPRTPNETELGKPSVGARGSTNLHSSTASRPQPRPSSGGSNQPQSHQQRHSHEGGATPASGQSAAQSQANSDTHRSQARASLDSLLFPERDTSTMDPETRKQWEKFQEWKRKKLGELGSAATAFAKAAGASSQPNHSTNPDDAKTSDPAHTSPEMTRQTSHSKPRPCTSGGQEKENEDESTKDEESESSEEEPAPRGWYRYGDARRRASMSASAASGGNATSTSTGSSTSSQSQSSQSHASHQRTRQSQKQDFKQQTFKNPYDSRDIPRARGPIASMLAAADRKAFERAEEAWRAFEEGTGASATKGSIRFADIPFPETRAALAPSTLSQADLKRHVSFYSLVSSRSIAILCCV